MSWKKINDISWRHTETYALVQVVPTRNDGGKRVYDVYVEARREPKHNRVKIPEIKGLSIANRNARAWMKKHPNG